MFAHLFDKWYDDLHLNYSERFKFEYVKMEHTFLVNLTKSLALTSLINENITFLKKKK